MREKLKNILRLSARGTRDFRKSTPTFRTNKITIDDLSFYRKRRGIRKIGEYEVRKVTPNLHPFRRGRREFFSITIEERYKVEFRKRTREIRIYRTPISWSTCQTVYISLFRGIRADFVVEQNWREFRIGRKKRKNYWKIIFLDFRD